MNAFRNILKTIAAVPVIALMYVGIWGYLGLRFIWDRTWLQVALQLGVIFYVVNVVCQ